MTTRKRLGAVCIALGVIACVLAFTASPVRAAAPAKAGWWFQLKSKAVPVPVVVPVVPDGGLYVQQGPSGPIAYGAVQANVAGADSATLILTIAPGSTSTLGAPLQACAVESPWEAPAPAPGAWEDAPKYTSTCTFGAVSSDGVAVAFFLEREFFAGDTLDVAIIPQDGATPFAIAFNKPDESSLTTKVAPTPFSAPPTTISAPSAGGSVSPPPASFRAPSSPTVTTPTAPAPEPPRSAIADSVLNIAGLGDPDRGERALSLGGASLILVGWWLLSSRSVPMPRLLGALASAPRASAEAGRVGGVGRFARTRDSIPRTLR